MIQTATSTAEDKRRIQYAVLQSKKNHFLPIDIKVVLHDHLDSPDSGIVRDAYGVPVPATYSQVDQVTLSLLLLKILISSRLNWRSL